MTFSQTAVDPLSLHLATPVVVGRWIPRCRQSRSCGRAGLFRSGIQDGVLGRVSSTDPMKGKILTARGRWVTEVLEVIASGRPDAKTDSHPHQFRE
jgi:hypothetical protein